jgi:hypothetical protein
MKKLTRVLTAAAAAAVWPVVCAAPAFADVAPPPRDHVGASDTRLIAMIVLVIVLAVVAGVIGDLFRRNRAAARRRKIEHDE